MRARRGRGRPRAVVTGVLVRALVLVAVIAGAWAAPSSASAAAGWTVVPRVDGTNWLVSVSCPSVGFCMAVDVAGNAVAFDGSSWQTPVSIDPPTNTHSNTLRAVSCSSASFCVAVDAAGQAVYYRNGIWSSPTDIDGTTHLTSVACPSSTFCVAGDYKGYALVYNGSSWNPAQVTNGGVRIVSVSCPSLSFCMTVDASGAAETLTSSWNWLGNIDTNLFLDAVSCASAQFCVATDSSLLGFGPAHEVTYDGSSWSAPAAVDTNWGLESVSCASAQFCAAVDSDGEALTYDGSSWSAPVGIDNTNQINSVSCPSTVYCVAVASFGDALAYLAPPTPVSPPSIAGTATQGQTLTEAHGTWTNGPGALSYGYQWEDCDSAGANCAEIPGATGQSYTLAATDVGHTVRAQETASNSAGPGSPEPSAPTAVVAPSATGTGGGTGSGASGGGTGSGPSGNGPGADAGHATAVASMRRPRISRMTATIPLTCTGPGTATCSVRLSLTIAETLKGHKVIALSAAVKRERTRRRVVSLGSVPVTLAGGQHRIVKLSLDAVGRRLLSHRRSLKAKLALVQSGRSLATITLAFRAR